MTRKRMHHIVPALVICLSLSMASFFVTPAEAKKITIKAISAWSKNEKSVADDYLGFIKRANEMVNAKYPGELEIRYLGGPEVIPTFDQPEGLRKGLADMYFGTAAYYAGIAPAANTTKLSQLTSQEEKEVGADGIYDEIHRKKLNATYLGALGSQVRFQLYTVKKVTTMDEIKGLRIRSSAMYLDFLKALGANAVVTKPGDIYQSLERGVVDGMMWPLFSIRPWGWHEVVKYIVGPPFYKVSHPLLVNLKKWNTIPEPIQELLREALRLEVQACDARTEVKVKNEYELLQKAGLQVIKFSPSDEKRYLDLAYSEGWKGQLKMESKYTQRLRKLLTK